MTQHQIKHDLYEIRIGWDTPLNTFFCSALDPNQDDEEQVLIWIGTNFDEYQNARQFLDGLKQQMEKHGITDVIFPDSLVETLEREQRENQRDDRALAGEFRDFPEENRNDCADD